MSLAAFIAQLVSQQALGFLSAIGLFLAMKIIDAVLSHFLNVTIFSRAWRLVKLRIKIFATRVNPIQVSYSFKLESKTSEKAVF